MRARVWRRLALLIFWPVLIGLSGQALAEDRSVYVSEIRSGNAITLIARLRNCTEATITITADLKNMRASSPLPLTTDASGRKEFTLVTLAPINPDAAWSCTWRSHWKPGARLKQEPAAYVYDLPYKDGPFTVMQGPHGRFSHGPGSQDEEAIDWAMPPGTKICAARAGVVTAIRQDCTEGGPDLKWKPDYNYMMIRHEDGTFAEYAHLQHDGALVAVGDRVTAQQAIALSGNTGYTTQPHLHFSVFYTLDGNTRKTLPVLFKDRAGHAVTIKQGISY